MATVNLDNELKSLGQRPSLVDAGINPYYIIARWRRVIYRILSDTHGLVATIVIIL